MAFWRLPEARKAVTPTTRLKDQNSFHCRPESILEEFSGLFDGFSQA